MTKGDAAQGLREANPGAVALQPAPCFPSKGDSAPGQPPAPSESLSLGRRVERPWRVFAKILSFAVFGAGALLLTVFVFPFCGLLPGTSDEKIDRSQRAIHQSFRFFMWFMEFVRVMEKTRFTGLERLSASAPCLIIANHPSLIDVVALLSRIPRVDCVVKKELWGNFFLRGVVQGANYIPNDGGVDIVDEAVRRIQGGRSVLLFPEGTRSPKGGLLGPFSRGFAQIAVRTGCALLPVTILCDPPELAKGDPLSHVAPRRPRWVISVDEPWTISRFFSPADTTAIAARKLTAALRRHYEERL